MGELALQLANEEDEIFVLPCWANVLESRKSFIEFLAFPWAAPITACQRVRGWDNRWTESAWAPTTVNAVAARYQFRHEE